MNWISNVVRPRIRSFLTTKREVPDNMWVQCPESGQMVFHKDLEANGYVIPGSNYHMRLSAQDRLALTFDDGHYDTVDVPDVPLDPLKFRDGKRYVDRLKEARAKSELNDAILIGDGLLDGRRVVIAAQDFRFMGGSLGMAAGEAVIAAIERALSNVTPFILFAASGGARMQEGILSLMQMPRTTIAVQRLRDAGLPYIVVMTDPTTGGVTASYAMLGDVHLAEPGALICFAGPRVIEQTIREQLPEGFQRAEYLYEHGMIDAVVHRHQMRETLARLCRVLGPQTLAQAKTDGDHDRAVNGVDRAPALLAAPAADGTAVNGDARGSLNGAAKPTTETADAAGAGADADDEPSLFTTRGLTNALSSLSGVGRATVEAAEPTTAADATSERESPSPSEDAATPAAADDGTAGRAAHANGSATSSGSAKAAAPKGTSPKAAAAKSTEKRGAKSASETESDAGAPAPKHKPPATEA